MIPLMRLADRIAQCRAPFVVEHDKTHVLTQLSGAADLAADVSRCPIRFVLNDDLTRLCTALAYSKGARTLAFTDLLHVPAETVWVEWCEHAWRSELAQYGFRPGDDPAAGAGRRGALIKSSRDGRRGSVRTLWAAKDGELNVAASSLEAYFDLDTLDGEEPDSPDGQSRPAVFVADGAVGGADALRRCFRFRFERSWADYYEHAGLSDIQQSAVTHHALGTIAIDIPVLFAFFLLLATRAGLPKCEQSMERLNRSRIKVGKPPLLSHIEVSAPLFDRAGAEPQDGSHSVRRRPRLHHVRGHLVRRGDQLFWRMPHVRGNARSGSIRARTVTWTFDRQTANRSVVGSPAP